MQFLKSDLLRENKIKHVISWCNHYASRAIDSWFWTKLLFFEIFKYFLPWFIKKKKKL